MSGTEKERPSRLVALLAIPLIGFAAFFGAVALDVWGDYLSPRFPNMRLMAFGVAMLTSCGCILMVALSALALSCLFGGRRG